LVYNWAIIDPPAAAQWLQTHLQLIEKQQYLFEDLIQGWFAKDQKGAMEYGLFDGSEKVPTEKLRAFAKWLMTFPLDLWKHETLTILFHTWHHTDTADLAAWLGE